MSCVSPGARQLKGKAIDFPSDTWFWFKFHQQFSETRHRFIYIRQRLLFICLFSIVLGSTWAEQGLSVCTSSIFTSFNYSVCGTDSQPIGAFVLHYAACMCWNNKHRSTDCRNIYTRGWCWGRSSSSRRHIAQKPHEREGLPLIPRTTRRADVNCATYGSFSLCRAKCAKYSRVICKLSADEIVWKETLEILNHIHFCCSNFSIMKCSYNYCYFWKQIFRFLLY